MEQPSRNFEEEAKKLDENENWSYCKVQKKINNKIQYSARKRLLEHANNGALKDQRLHQDGERQRLKAQNIAKGWYKPKNKPNQKNQKKIEKLFYHKKHYLYFCK